MGEAKLFLPDEMTWSQVEAGSLKLPNSWIPDMSLNGRLETYRHYQPFDWIEVAAPEGDRDEFQVSGLSPCGRALFYFHHPDYGTIGSWFEVEPGVIRPVELVVRRRPHIRIRVIDEESHVVPGARIIFGTNLDPKNKDLIQLEEGDGAAGRVAFGEKGNYRYLTYSFVDAGADGIAERTVPPGLTYGVSAMSPDGAAYGRRILLPDDVADSSVPFDILAHRQNAYGVKLRFVDGDGHPIPDLRFSYGIVDDPWMGKKFHGSTGEDGISIPIFLVTPPCFIGITDAGASGWKTRSDRYTGIPAPGAVVDIIMDPYVPNEE